MSDLVLFGGYEPPAPPEPPEPVSADRRRTLRQVADIAVGVHPLTRRPVHLLADLNPQPTDAKALPYRCGSCVFREVVPYHNRAYPKCLWPGTRGADELRVLDDYPRISHSTASDVRAWWPACRDYSPGDTGLSRDAARCIPD